MNNPFDQLLADQVTGVRAEAFRARIEEMPTPALRDLELRLESAISLAAASGSGVLMLWATTATLRAGAIDAEWNRRLEDLSEKYSIPVATGTELD